MSALGQKPTYALHWGMSALPPKADICSVTAHVCYGPKADIAVNSEERQMSVRFICSVPVKRQNDLKFHSVGVVGIRRQPAPMRFDNGFAN